MQGEVLFASLAVLVAHKHNLLKTNKNGRLTWKTCPWASLLRLFADPPYPAQNTPSYPALGIPQGGNWSELHPHAS